MAEPQISSLIANAHDPSSGDFYTGDELMPAWMELRLVGPAMPENSGPVGRFRGKEVWMGASAVNISTHNPTHKKYVLYDFRVLWQSPRSCMLL